MSSSSLFRINALEWKTSEIILPDTAIFRKIGNSYVDKLRHLSNVFHASHNHSHTCRINDLTFRDSLCHQICENCLVPSPNR